MVDQPARPALLGPERRGYGRLEGAALALSIVVLAVVSSTRLGRTGLWMDEAWSLAAVNDLGLSLRTSHGTMAAYYTLLWVWGRVDTSVEWLRLLSTVFGASTLVVTQLIARRIGGRALAVVAPLFLVASPMFLWKATEARAYALETLLTAVAWYAAIRIGENAAEQTRSARWYLLLFALVLVGPLTHGLFYAQLVALGVYLAIRLAETRRILVLAAMFVIGTGVTIVLWELGLSNAGSVYAFDSIRIFRSLLAWYLDPNTWIARLLGALIVVAVVVSLFERPEDPDRPRFPPRLPERFIVPIIWTFVPLASLLFVRATHSVWAPYYLAPVTPGVALLLAASVTRLVRAVAPAEGASGTRVAVAWGVAAVLIVVVGWSSFSHPRQITEDWRGAAHLIAEQARDSDGLVLLGSLPGTPYAVRAPFEAAWGELDPLTTPAEVSPRRPLGRVLRSDRYLKPAEIRSATLRYPRVWVVDYRDMYRGVEDDPPLAESAFDLVRRWDLKGDITVRLFERVP